MLLQNLVLNHWRNNTLWGGICHEANRERHTRYIRVQRVVYVEYDFNVLVILCILRLVERFGYHRYPISIVRIESFF